MTKIEFLVCLDEKLSGISEDDKKRTLEYYAEMIDDKVEDGMSEEEAVSELGDIQEIVKRIFREIPLIELVKEKLKPKRRLKPAEIALIALGFPVWLPLIISAFAVVFTLWVTVYAVIISLYSVVLALAASAVGCVIIASINMFTGSIAEGLILLSFAFVSAGLAPLIFIPLNKLTKLTFELTKNIIYEIKKSIAK